MFFNIISVILLLLNCQNYDSGEQANVGLNTDVEADFVPDEELDISTFLDLYAGHPFDEDLPDAYLGVDDEELEETSGRHIHRILTEGLRYAKLNSGTARYMFEVGRTAYLSDHDSASVWLRSAAQNGSVAAMVYLGYNQLDQGNAEIALNLFKEGQQKGFADPVLFSIIKLTAKSIFDPQKFNRPQMIEALYNQQLQRLSYSPVLKSLYVGAIHNTLWSNDILFIIDDPEIFLKLDANISAKEGLQADNVLTNQIKQILQSIRIFSSSKGPSKDEVAIIEYGIQDARRLAIMYENNPRALEKVYAGMVAYSRISE